VSHPSARRKGDAVYSPMNFRLLESRSPARSGRRQYAVHHRPPEEQRHYTESEII
jgi:hypothetical protein